MRLQKLISLLLICALAVGLAIPAAAYTQLSVGVAQNVNISDDEAAAIFQFIPKASGYYCFYSYDCGTDDPYGYILDSNQQLLSAGDDSGEGDFNFRISCYLYAGQTYYLGATTYTGTAQYTVQVETLTAPTSIRFREETVSGYIGHSYTPEFILGPEGCATVEPILTSSNPDVVYVDEYNFLYFISPGTAVITATLHSGASATCFATTLEPDPIYLDQSCILDAADAGKFLTFLAPAAGWYGVCSEGDEIDVSVSLYDKDFIQIGFDDDSLGNSNFFAPVYLEAGQHCYLHIEHYNESGTCSVSVRKLDYANTVSLAEDRVVGFVGGFCHLTPVYSPITAIAETLTWTSSNESVALVDEYGYVDFLSAGTATIGFTSETGKTDSVTVTVQNPPAGSSIVDYGICGPQLQWKLTTDGALTVTGSGPMYDNADTWQVYAGQITSVSLPKDMTTLGSYAFDGCTGLTQVVLPDGLTRIGNNAFSNCSGISAITIPKTVTEIGYSAFLGCSSIEEVTLPDGLQRLGHYAFSLCEELRTVNCGTGLKRLPMGAFNRCAALVDVTLPEKLVSIGDRAFYESGLEQIDLPEGLISIGCSAFESCYLRQVNLPASLERLHSYAFSFCPIPEATLPAALTYFGEGVFYGTPTEKLYFTGKAPAFAESAFLDMYCQMYYPAMDESWTEDLRQSYNGYYILWTAEQYPVSVSGSIAAAVPVTVELWAQGSTEADFTGSFTGSYRFENIPQGNYTVKVSAKNYVNLEVELELTADRTLDLKLRLVGDVNGDGRVNIGDAARVYSHARGTSTITDPYGVACADINSDNRINVGDAARVYAHVRGTKPLY